MKKKRFLLIFCCILAAVIFLILLIPRKELSNTVTFYYARSEFAYGTPNGAIGSEERQVGGHENDLNYLLALYLEGPLNKDLRSPLPGKHAVRILELDRVGDALHIRLSDLSNVMSDSEFTLASACLTRTCLEICRVQAVQIESGARSVRMNPANLQFYDESTSVVLPEREEHK